MKVRINTVVKDLDSVCVRYTILDNDDKSLFPEQDLSLKEIGAKNIDDIKKQLIEIVSRYEKAISIYDDLKNLEGKFLSLNKDTSSIEVK